MPVSRIFYLWSLLTALIACSTTHLLTGGEAWRGGDPWALVQLFIAAAGLFVSFACVYVVTRYPSPHSANPPNSANSTNPMNSINSINSPRRNDL